jgi:hypothetical protein
MEIRFTLLLKFNSIQQYVIKFDSDLWQVGGFTRLLRFVSSTNKTDRHDITEILLKVALNTLTLTMYISLISKLKIRYYTIIDFGIGCYLDLST